MKWMITVEMEETTTVTEDIKYQEHCLKATRIIGDRAREGRATGNLGNASKSLSGYRKAIECQKNY